MHNVGDSEYADIGARKAMCEGAVLLFDSATIHIRRKNSIGAILAYQRGIDELRPNLVFVDENDDLSDDIVESSIRDCFRSVFKSIHNISNLIGEIASRCDNDDVFWRLESCWMLGALAEERK